MQKSSSVKRETAVVAGVKGLPKTKKFGGKTFTKKTCSKSKTAAKVVAKQYRKSGKNARVVQDPKTKSYCVFARG